MKALVVLAAQRRNRELCVDLHSRNWQLRANQQNSPSKPSEFHLQGKQRQRWRPDADDLEDVTVEQLPNT